MVNPEPTQNLQGTSTTTSKQPLDQAPTPFRCLTGALISGAFAIGLYALTLSIHRTLDATPITSTHYLTVRISTLVRSLVVGMGALGTITFSVTTLGLLGLMVQLLIKGTPAPEDRSS